MPDLAATPVVNEEVRVSEEDVLRAQLYRLLAHFLRAPPGEEDLAKVARMHGDETPLGSAVQSFARVAAKSSAEAVEQEYNDLFIGLGRGELLPYGSYYLTGFLHEKPLAKLRTDMARIGIERLATVHEPEDHIAALCEMMDGLITGAFGAPAPLEEQKRFFDAHIKPWAKQFFVDLEGARSSVLYAAVGSIGRVFMEIEEVAFTMD